MNLLHPNFVAGCSRRYKCTRPNGYICTRYKIDKISFLDIKIFEYKGFSANYITNSNFINNKNSFRNNIFLYHTSFNKHKQIFRALLTVSAVDRVFYPICAGQLFHSVGGSGTFGRGEGVQPLHTA